MVKSEDGLKKVRGTAVIESLTVGIFLVLLVTVMIEFCYFFSAQQIMETLAHEALICASHGKSQVNCREEFQKRIKSTVNWGNIKYFELKSRGRNSEVHINFEKGFLFHYKKIFYAKDLYQTKNN